MTEKKSQGHFPRQSSASEKAYAHVREKIASGEFSPGQPLFGFALAQEIHISQTPIRKALRRFASEGASEQSPNRPAVVVKLTQRDIIELYELREALETFAVGKAARQPLPPSMIDKMQSLADSILSLEAELDRSGKSNLDRQQLRRFMGWDFAFHTQLMRLASNERILKIINETRVLIRIFCDSAAWIYRKATRGNAPRAFGKLSRRCRKRLPVRSTPNLSYFQVNDL